jgi:hypothetical protein
MPHTRTRSRVSRAGAFVAALISLAAAGGQAGAQDEPAELEQPATTLFAVGAYVGSYTGIRSPDSGQEYSIGGIGGWATLYVPVKRVGPFWRPAIGAYYTYTAEQSGFTTTQVGGEVGIRLFGRPVYRTAEPFLKVGVGSLHFDQKQAAQPGEPLVSYSDMAVTPGAGITFTSFFNPERVIFRGQLNDMIVVGRDGRDTSHHFTIEGGALFRF